MLPDVRYALKVRGSAVLGRGYDQRKRRLSPDKRVEVVARDGGRCRECGGLGAEVDHVRGSGSDLENLRLLCKACHRRKTEASLRPLNSLPEEEQREKRKLIDKLEARVSAAIPQRLCDDEMGWDRQWPLLQKERQRLIADWEERSVFVGTPYSIERAGKRWIIVERRKEDAGSGGRLEVRLGRFDSRRAALRYAAELVGTEAAPVSDQAPLVSSAASRSRGNKGIPFEEGTFSYTSLDSEPNGVMGAPDGLGA
jgi:hypothetical protein